MSDLWITTRGGDKGMTSLCDGSRVPKDDPRVKLYGTVDECQAHIGMARALCQVPEIAQRLKAIEQDLYKLMAALALCKDSAVPDVASLETYVQEARQVCQDRFAFVLPGDSAANAAFHVARTVARRAERLALGLLRQGQIDERAFVYMNRLSDVLFALSLWHDALVSKG